MCRTDQLLILPFALTPWVGNLMKGIAHPTMKELQGQHSLYYTNSWPFISSKFPWLQQWLSNEKKSISRRKAEDHWKRWKQETKNNVLYEYGILTGTTHGWIEKWDKLLRALSFGMWNYVVW